MKILYCYYCRVFGWLQSPLLLLMRLYWGWGFFVAGKGKFADPGKVIGFFEGLGIPAPHFTVYLVATVEALGGLLLMSGLGARLAALPLAVTMIVAYATAHLDAAQLLFSEPSAFIKEDPFLFLLTTLLVLAFGPGALSLDRCLKGKCQATCESGTCKM